MSERRTVFKWWASWNDHRIEAWLGQMAAEGWHLESVGAFGPYRFSRGGPAQVAYRIDFWPNQGRDASYEQLFKDAGWELAASTVGWSFWRHPYIDGKAPEIFTDDASKIAKYRRWLALGVAMVPLNIAILVAASRLPGGSVERVLAYGSAAGMSVFTIIACASLMARISTLKQH